MLYWKRLSIESNNRCLYTEGDLQTQRDREELQVRYPQLKCTPGTASSHQKLGEVRAMGLCSEPQKEPLCPHSLISDFQPPEL